MEVGTQDVCTHPWQATGGRKRKQEQAEAGVKGGGSLRFTLTTSGQTFPMSAHLDATTLLPTKHSSLEHKPTHK